ncbi:MAG TPA: TerB family tellurite resistance protein [Candidatus Limnocylindrales bacterium]
MSIFRRLFGGAAEPGANGAPASDVADDGNGVTPSPGSGAHASADASAPDTATVRRIVSQLEAMPPDRARYLAAASYVLARVANSDLVISPEETSFMERTLVKESAIGEAEAVLVVEAAKQQARLFGSTEDYLVTREFRQISGPDQRLRLLRACFLAAAADNSISSAESATLNQIASELDVDAAALSALRSEFGDRLSVVQAMRAARAGTPADRDPTVG